MFISKVGSAQCSRLKKTMRLPLRRFRQWTRRQNSIRATFTELRAEVLAMIRKMDCGKRQSDQNVICAFMRQAIPPVISEKLFGKKELDWLSMRVTTVRAERAIGSNA